MKKKRPKIVSRPALEPRPEEPVADFLLSEVWAKYCKARRIDVPYGEITRVVLTFSREPALPRTVMPVVWVREEPPPVACIALNAEGNG